VSVQIQLVDLANDGRRRFVDLDPLLRLLRVLHVRIDQHGSKAERDAARCETVDRALPQTSTNTFAGVLKLALRDHAAQQDDRRLLR
jgi:hypothetical protein